MVWSPSVQLRTCWAPSETGLSIMYCMLGAVNEFLSAPGRSCVATFQLAGRSNFNSVWRPSKPVA